jgi:Polysaccharide deacetylase
MEKESAAELLLAGTQPERRMQTRRRLLAFMSLGIAASVLPRKIKKIATLHMADWTGTMDWMLNSPWRRERLLILGFHGVARHDEHRQCPALFMSEDRFARRMKLLHDQQCCVLRLQESLQHMWRGSLPPRSTVLTFDDGYYNFESVLPLLQKYRFPATVYLTTEYVDHDLPVFNLLCPYLFWKSPLEEITLDGLAGLAKPLYLDLRPATAREKAANLVKAFSASLSVCGKGRKRQAPGQSAES